MIGQGRPLRRNCWLAPVALSLCALCAVGRGAEPMDVRVRIAWGGGDARPWQGTIRIKEGTLSEVTPLGLEPDAPGSMHIQEPGTIRIFGRTPRSYDGCDVRITAPEGAVLLVQLTADPAKLPAALELPLAKVVRDFTQFDLDDRGNRLLAQRSPGDALRVNFSKPSLIFSPGEKFDLNVQPQHAALTANTTYVLAASMGPARTDDNRWSEDIEVRVDNSGNAKSVPLSIPLPEQEGVYDVRLALYPKRLVTSALVRGKALASRKLQLVVIAPVKTAGPPPAAWQSILEFDPASPSWWERMARLPSWARLPTVPRPVESGPASSRMHMSRAWVELPRHAWQAYPLSISAPGMPHVLEVEYPSDLEQTLGISIIEPNAAGYVGPIGVDSGVDVPRPAIGHKSRALRHRLVFWPQTKTPYVLLVNRRDDLPATFGKIDVQAGPSSLPPLPVTAVSYGTRTLAAYYDKPLIAENFSATEAVDPVSRRGLDDWITFLSAGQRLVETLQHSGCNALVLTAACEGSAIYPSELLAPTPKYDSGVFFESGQDAVRKDVLELLFRLCDRSGLVLIPAIQFAGPLPALEAMRQAGGADVAGIEPLGPDGRTWLGRNSTGSGVCYNALDERVQQSMTAVVAELAERYGKHASFGGVAVQLSAENYSLLPDETCSLDDTTFGRFLAATKTDAPRVDQPAAMARWNLIRGPAAQAWLAWRSERLAGLYRVMRDEVVKHRPGAKLYLTTATLLSGRQLQTALRPELPPRDSASEILPLVGLDLSLLNESGIVVPRPQRILTPISPQAHDQELHWNRNAALDVLFAKPAQGATLHFLPPASLRLPDFDAVSPFGPDKTRTLLIAQVAPSDSANRERFIESLARFDAAVMIDGGWLLPLGQEMALAPLAKVYRRLPAERFESISSSGQVQEQLDQPQELVVRALNKADKTYFYVANPTPWPVSAQIQFSGPAGMRLIPYSDERSANYQPSERGTKWTVELEAFDLVGGELSGAARVVGWNVSHPAELAQSLGEQSREIATRTRYLSDHPRPLGLVNPSFEERGTQGEAVGWVHARGPGMIVEVDGTKGSGSRNSLHMVSRGAGGPVWVRSSPLAAPATGRLQMTARIRVADAARQPQLRLAVEGKLEGQPYYRRVNVGAAEGAGGQVLSALNTEWATYTIALTDLPDSGLTGLCVGFDLMSEGEVWIDDVQVSSLWLAEHEHRELFKSAPTANHLAQSGRLNECRLLVEGYWPSFLRRSVQLPDPELAPIRHAAATELPKPSDDGRRADGNDRNWLERTAERNRKWLPSWLRWR